MASILCRRLLLTRTLCVKELSVLAAWPSTNVITNHKLFEHNTKSSDQNKIVVAVPFPSSIHIKYYSTQSDDKGKDEVAKEETKKLSLFQKFKSMYRDYWYVLVPVHLVTSAVWFGGFYYAAKSGIDIVGLLEYWNVHEKVVNSLKDSSMGYLTVAYALYKIATPVRYTVTVGGTTVSINYLKKWGYIKPVPSKEKLKEMYHDKKETFARTVQETKEEILETKENIIETIHEKKEEIKDKKDSILKNVEKTKDTLKKKTEDIARNLHDYNNATKK